VRVCVYIGIIARFLQKGGFDIYNIQGTSRAERMCLCVYVCVCIYIVVAVSILSMGRRENINQLLDHLRGYTEYVDIQDVLNQYSYTSGISVRTLAEYVSVLQSMDQVKLSYVNPDPNKRYHINTRWLVPSIS
jgi:hypothetical protein